MATITVVVEELASATVNDEAGESFIALLDVGSTEGRVHDKQIPAAAIAQVVEEAFTEVAQVLVPPVAGAL